MPPKRKNFDQAIKEIFLSGRDGLLLLLGLHGVVWDRELESELVAPRRHADLVWLVIEDSQPVIIHIEIQIQPDNDMERRMAEYGTRIHFREGIVVRSYVIYLKPVTTLPTSPYAPPLPDGTPSMIYPFTVIALWELSPDAILQTPFTDLWPLAVLMQGTSHDLALDVARKIATAPISTEHQERLEGLLVLLAGLRLPVAPLANLFQEDKMLKEIFQHSSLRELLIQEVGEEKLAEGRAEGHAEGELKASRKMLERLAQQHFGKLSDVLRETIDTYSDTERLQDAILGMNGFADEEALATFLATPSSTDENTSQE